MPFKPVISINVDDEQFRDFVKIFDQYQSKLKDTDSEWSKAARTMNHGFGDRAGSKLHDMADTLSGMNPSIRGIGGGIIALSRHMGVLGGAFHVVTSSIGVMVRGLKDAVKLSAELGVASAAAVAAYDKLANVGMGRIAQARGMNTTTGRLAAFQSATRGILPESLPQSIVQAMTSPSSTALSGLALQQAHLTPSEALNHPVAASLQLADAAHQYAKQHRGQTTAFWNTNPTMQGFAALGLSTADVLRLGRTSAASLKLMADTVQQDAKKLQISPHTFIELQKFHTDLAVAGRTLETDLINRLRVLGPSLGSVLGSLTSRFVQLVNDVLSPGNLKALQRGLSDVDKFLASGGVTKALTSFKAELDTVETDVAKDWPKVESAALSAASAISTLAGDVKGFESSPFVKWLSKHSQSPAKTAAELRNPEGWKQAFPWAKRVADMFGVHVSRAPNMVNFHDPKIRKAMDAANTALGIPHFMQNIAMQESSGNANAVNPRTGAEGLFQDLPGIAQRLGFNPLDPMQAITGNLRLALSNAHALGGQFTHADTVGRMDLLAAAHDMGVTKLRAALARYGSLGAAMPHLPHETQAYIGSVNQREGDWARSVAGNKNQGTQESIERNTAVIARAVQRSQPRVVYKPQIAVQADLSQQAFAAAAVGGTP